MVTKARQILSILQNDTFIVMFDNTWTIFFDHASSQEILNEFREQVSRMQTAISGCEDSIKQFNTGWRIDELVSFKVTCQASRIYVFLLQESYRLVIINRFGDGTPEDSPNIDRTLAEVAKDMAGAIYALSSAHNQ